MRGIDAHPPPANSVKATFHIITLRVTTHYEFASRNLDHFDGLRASRANPYLQCPQTRWPVSGLGSGTHPIVPDSAYPQTPAPAGHSRQGLVPPNPVLPPHRQSGIQHTRWDGKNRQPQAQCTGCAILQPLTTGKRVVNCHERLNLQSDQYTSFQHYDGLALGKDAVTLDMAIGLFAACAGHLAYPSITEHRDANPNHGCTDRPAIPLEHVARGKTQHP